MSQSFDRIKIKKNQFHSFSFPPFWIHVFIFCVNRPLGSAKLSRKWMWNFFFCRLENALVVISFYFVTAKNHRASATRTEKKSVLSHHQHDWLYKRASDEQNKNLWHTILVFATTAYVLVTLIR